jgi:hypothetical protein
MNSCQELYERAQELNTRVDAFFKRRADRQARKDARRARRDGDDPPTCEYEMPPDFRDDEHLNPERSELRQGALSREQ